MTFKHTGRFIPERLKSDPKLNFSRPISRPESEWFSNPKPQNDIFGLKLITNLGFTVSSSNRSTRNEIDSYHM